MMWKHTSPLLLMILVATVQAKYQEMTHVMDPDVLMIHPAYADPKYHHKIQVDTAGPWGSIPFVAFNIYSTGEHFGTHFDAPYHFNKDGRKVHEIPLDDLHGPLVRIDIREKAQTNKNATVDIKDLLKWESDHGKIPNRAYVLMDSGWRHNWGNQEAFIGSNSPNFGSLSWPGFSFEAAKWLVEERKILGVGVDTISCELPGIYDAHIILHTNDKMCVENLNNMDKVPDAGAEFFHMPMIQKGGTGGQVRAYAFWHPKFETSLAKMHVPFCGLIAIVIILFMDFLYI